MTQLRTTATAFATSTEGEPPLVTQIIALLKGMFWGKSNSERGISVPEEEETVPKKYVHVPTHAASSFLRTATPKHMKKANEIL
ncbi:hypothetical protein JX265_001562 [Neoarthrinium moseri]|uniref:Uncharacterized protein n=1 Tax=Neoarthrinium moseri TaxID=1658444 RepID=A0A9P9WVU4_9PEZI|nr:uncharacterized protein JN550_003957 [Neoarthrinium moseri]KAI1844577.1 hypothetical protein JX266_009250 [Neoarthrinium moseri]KAI1872238.1 hypothetical protein JN550_003957 [Neoarthrinium moseri]KAI1879941.1 hypothetical protein JX265_001562 [Neoarthrinium moseri]